MEDNLVQLENLWFCPYHLPFSVETCQHDVGIDGQSDHAILKGSWSAQQIDAFNTDIQRRLKNALAAEEACDLTGTVFPGDVDFSSRKIPEVSFAATQFSGRKNNFTDSSFSGSTDFSNTIFKNGQANFSGATFTSHTRFTNAKFDAHGASFANTKFRGYLNFDHADFEGGGTIFSNADFLMDIAHFSHTRFTGSFTDFSDVHFQCTEIFFTGCTFGDNVSFQRAHFNCHTTHFSKAKFSANSHIDFGSTLFSGKLADFSDAHFNGAAVLFSSSNFSVDQVNFQTRKFQDSEQESLLSFGTIKFDGARFSGFSNFTNRPFLNESLFVDADFRKAPKFHGCTLHQNTTFPPIENFKDTKSDGAAHSYRTLRLAMKQQEAHDEEAMFWALEQRSKRNSMECNPLNNWKNLFNWIPWLLSAVYALLSNYGLSINRPLIALTGWLYGATPVLYFCLRATVDKLCGSTTYGDLLGFSLSQSLRPFFIWGDYDGSGIKSILGRNVDVLSVKLFATADSLISLVLIALLILAVRRRFRMQ